jgi:hypothetical protein
MNRGLSERLAIPACFKTALASDFGHAFDATFTWVPAPCTRIAAFMEMRPAEPS